MHSVSRAWIGYYATVALLLALDLGVGRRGRRAAGMRAGLIGFGMWFAVAVAFGVLLGLRRGAEPSQQFAAGYLIELSLSIDNLLVFVLVFDRFRIDPDRQHRVLFWGVLGAAVLRTGFILGGMRAIRHAHWLVPAGGALIVATGAKLGISAHSSGSLGSTGEAATGFLAARVRPDGGGDGRHFFVVENGRRVATSLFAALLVLEAADLIFALDSLPAVIAVTRDAFVATSSNILAILGLRSLYLVVQGSMRRFRFLRPGLSVLLVFVGLKMLAERWIQVSTGASLGVIGIVLAASAAASLLVPENRPAGNA